METFTILALLSRCSTFVEREVLICLLMSRQNGKLLLPWKHPSLLTGSIQMHAWHAPDSHAGFRADLISCACELVRLVCKLGGEVRAASPMKKRSAAPSTGAEALQSPHGKSAASGNFSESFTYEPLRVDSIRSSIEITTTYQENDQFRCTDLAMAVYWATLLSTSLGSA